MDTFLKEHQSLIHNMLISFLVLLPYTQQPEISGNVAMRDFYIKGYNW